MRVPYLYKEPKTKNFEKYRPIASYYLHPLKKVYKVAGQGLMVILKTIETSHMNIFSTYDTKSKIEAIFNEINSFEEQHNCQPNIQTYAGDIKQLYTELDFETIQKSIIWAVNMVQKTKTARGKKYVTINICDPKLSRIGPKYSGRKLTNISFEDIIKICLFDTQNAFFQKNQEILQQILGIAQGSPSSPSIAITVLIAVEHHFFDSIRDNQRFSKHKFTGMRYMDDIRNVVITINIPPEILKSKELIGKFINSLPETLILEAEESENNTFRFLEGCQFYNDPTIKAAFIAKNFNIHGQDEHYELKAGFPFQPYLQTYTDKPIQEMENNIFTRFFAISAYTITEKGLELAMTSSIPDFQISGFPLKNVKKVMTKFKHRLPSHLQNTWENIKNRLK